ncbi:hypothetical protein COR50_17390 [Chitinophaga caeni]|uniref:DUF4129 domain-containing protein n=1 Tax=Chitinophaga caeni TaxID=2029983 RepID=A0A291QY54_9BACT|nr:hypothetical protein [Chitinophaga caeni]ATL48794.1 hypothetical protein COR50_17390 [Chitinophaga caeni]
MKTLLTIILTLLLSLTFAQTNGKVIANNKAVDAKPDIDTVSTTKVELLNSSFDKLVSKLTEDKKETNSIWNTLIPLLIGAGLTLIAQFAIEYWKTNKENESKKREIISKGRARTYLIAQVLKDLAMYKVHKQYYWRASQIEQDGSDSFKKHYEKGQQQRETKVRLDDNIAEYFQLVTEYSIVAKKHDHFKQYFVDIFNYVHPKSSNFSECNTKLELPMELNKEEERLNEEYKKLIELFEKIQSEMK